MMKETENEGMLSPYRVLDLTEGGCLLGGKVLGDLGADVIKIEKPGGSPSRLIGPFYRDVVHPEKSLYWYAYNTNKRGITLNIDTVDGQDIFCELVKRADIVIESFPPGHMRSLGLSYEDLSRAKSDIIVTSITPYGQTGPKANYASSELTAWASGSALFLMGDPDRPPTWIGFPQALLHAGVEAAAASLHALWHRNMTGEGQDVDVSIQECVIWTLTNSTGFWECNRFDPQRQGFTYAAPNVTMPLGLPCKDGWVSPQLSAGSQAGMVASMMSLVAWMDEEGMAPDWLKEFDWVYGFDMMTVTQETMDKVAQAVGKFLLTKTKTELYDGAIQRRILLAPVSSAKEIYEDKQLRARDYWVRLEHPELGDTLTYCGAPVRLSEASWQLRRRAPLIGEHNDEVYQKELGFSNEKVAMLKTAGVI